MTLSSATLSWVWVVFRPCLLRFQKFLKLDSSFGIPLIMKLDLLRFLLTSQLLLNPQTLYEFDEGFDVRKRWFLRLFLGFLFPVDLLDFEHCSTFGLKANFSF